MDFVFDSCTNLYHSFHYASSIHHTPLQYYGARSGNRALLEHGYAMTEFSWQNSAKSQLGLFGIRTSFAACIYLPTKPGCATLWKLRVFLHGLLQGWPYILLIIDKELKFCKIYAFRGLNSSQPHEILAVYQWASGSMHNTLCDRHVGLGYGQLSMSDPSDGI